MTSSFDDTCDILPSAKTWPSWSTVTLQPSASTNSISCSTTMTVCSPAKLLSSSAVLSVSASVIPRCRLVHQQHLRFLQQEHANLKPLLLSMRQSAAQLIQRVSKTDARSHLSPSSDDLVDEVSARLRAMGERFPASASSRFSQTVSVSINTGFLKLAANAKVGNLGLVKQC